MNDVPALPARTGPALRHVPRRLDRWAGGLALLLACAVVGGPAVAASGPPVPSVAGRQHLAPVHARWAPAVSTPRWSWPLEPVPGVLRDFEKPPRNWQRGHRGVDLSVGAGGSVSVLSPADGVVFFAGTVVDRGVLSIDHGGGRISSFEPVGTHLVKGQRVGEGDVVAMLAAATGSAPTRGHCGVPCLHWGVRVDGDYVDPLSFVLDRRPSVLLPLENRPDHRVRDPRTGNEASSRRHLTSGRRPRYP